MRLGKCDEIPVPRRTAVSARTLA